LISPENEEIQNQFGNLLLLIANLAQVNFGGPKIFSQKFWELLKLRIWQQVTMLRTGVRWPSAGLRIINYFGKVRLSRVHLSINNKDCHNVKAFSQGPLS